MKYVIEQNGDQWTATFGSLSANGCDAFDAMLAVEMASHHVADDVEPTTAVRRAELEQQLQQADDRLSKMLIRLAKLVAVSAPVDILTTEADSIRRAVDTICWAREELWKLSRKGADGV